MRATTLLTLGLGLCCGFAAAQLGYDNCLGCHDPVGPAIVKTPHAKANGVLCSDCHGEHGGPPSPENIRSLKKSPAREIFQTCTRCHTGFHANESTHAKTDRACLSCHDMWHSETTTAARPTPANRLVKKNSVELCLSCHTNAPPFVDLANPRYFNCSSCHPGLHGSNVSNKFLDSPVYL